MLIFSGYAQDQKFTRLTEEDGLPGNNAYSFLKDDRGFVWIGTANGLCRYDGYEITSFTQEQGYSISNDHINALIQDSNGIIWIGTDAGGLNAFNPRTETFESFTHDPIDTESIAGDRIQSITEGEENTLWIGFDNGFGLSKFNTETKKFTNYKPFEALSMKGVRAIRDLVYDKKNNKVWLGATHGLISFDLATERFQLINHPLTSINRHGLFALDQIDENRLLGGFFHAGVDIYNINEQSWDEVYTDPSEVLRTYNLSRKSESEFWVAARRKGLAIFDLKSKELRFVKSNIDNQTTPFPGFTYEVEGFDKDVWAGSKHGVSYAISKTLPFTFDSLYFRNPEKGRVTDISGRYDKIYMIGVDNRLWEIDKITNQKNIYEVTSGSLSTITGMLEIKDRIYFVSNGKEILVFDKATKKTRVLVNAGDFKEVSFYAIKPWREDKALIMTRYGGLFSLDLNDDQIERIHETKILDLWQNDMLLHADGSIWIGTIKSVIILSSDGETVDYMSPDVISSKEKYILSIEQDKEGTIWLGTAHGLVKIQNEKETLYNTLNSDLPVNFISGIEFDKDDLMWVKTRKGVTKIDPKTMKMIHFDRSDGIDSEGVLRSIDGEMYYGVLGGYYNLSEEIENSREEIPKVYLTNFQIFGEKKPLESTIDFTNQIDLPYWENSFSFSFTSPTFTEPQKIKFAYRLVGQDKDWIVDSNRRYANYTNLDGGTYVFEVKAGTKNDLWSDPRKITIILASPFWETWWFYTLCCLAIIGAGFGFYKTRINILQRKADQEAQELRLEAFQKRLSDLNASPPDLVLNIDDVNSKLSTPLSEREFEVLQMSLDGKTNAEIAEGLFISLSTVKFHLRNTYSKLGVSNRKEALVYVVKKP